MPIQSCNVNGITQFIFTKFLSKTFGQSSSCFIVSLFIWICKNCGVDWGNGNTSIPVSRRFHQDRDLLLPSLSIGIISGWSIRRVNRSVVAHLDNPIWRKYGRQESLLDSPWYQQGFLYCGRNLGGFWKKCLHYFNYFHRIAHVIVLCRFLSGKSFKTVNNMALDK